MSRPYQAASRPQMTLFGASESGVFRIDDRARGHCYSCGALRTIAVSGRCASCAGQVQRSRGGPGRGNIVRAVIADARAGLGTLEALSAEAGISPLSVRRSLLEARTGAVAGQRRGQDRPHGPLWTDDTARPPVAWLRDHGARLVAFVSDTRSWPELCQWGRPYGLTDNQLSELVCWAEEKGDIAWDAVGWKVAEDEP